MEKSGKVGAIYAQKDKTDMDDKPIGVGDAAGNKTFYLVETFEVCDDHAGTEWSATESGVLSTDEVIYKEGLKAVRDTTPETSVEETEYKTKYTKATGAWDWHDKARISFWFYCDKISTVFQNARFYVQDTAGNRSYWTLTFGAEIFVRFNLPLGDPTGYDAGGTHADLTKVKFIEWNLETKLAYTEQFFKVIDWIGLTPQSIDKDITVKVAGVTQAKGTYLHSVSGKLIFKDVPADEAAVVATYDIYTIYQVGGFFNWAITQAITTLDKTDFQSAGWKEFISGLKEWSATAERHWMTDESLVTWLGVTKIIKLFLATDTDPLLRYEGWAVVNGLNPAVAIDTIINESLSFQGTGQLSYENE